MSGHNLERKSRFGDASPFWKLKDKSGLSLGVGEGLNSNGLVKEEASKGVAVSRSILACQETWFSNKQRGCHHECFDRLVSAFRYG